MSTFVSAVNKLTIVVATLSALTVSSPGEADANCVEVAEGSRPSQCAGFGQTACNQQMGCGWPTGCSGLAGPCCGGQIRACDQIANASTCLTQTGCTWRQTPIFDFFGQWFYRSVNDPQFGPVIRRDGDGFTIDMSFCGRPTARGRVVDGGSEIRVSFPDDTVLIGALRQNPERIDWRNGTTWFRDDRNARFVLPTVFELAGRYVTNGPVSTIERRSGRVEMNIPGQGRFAGCVYERDRISMYLGRGVNLSGRLLSNGRIEWSNGTVWRKDGR